MFISTFPILYTYLIKKLLIGYFLYLFLLVAQLSYPITLRVNNRTDKRLFTGTVYLYKFYIFLQHYLATYHIDTWLYKIRYTVYS
jgi:hypothetical protein